MPIIRKVIDVGRSKAVTLPKTWLDYFEKELGRPIERVAVEVDRQLTIVPYTPKRDDETAPKEKEPSSHE